MKRRRRAKTVYIVLALLVVGCLFAAWLLSRPGKTIEPVEPPDVDLTMMGPAAAASIRGAAEGVRQDSDSGPAWGRLGMVLFAHQFHREPQVCFRQAELLDPEDERWPYLYALAIQSDDREAAAAALERALALRSDPPPVMHNRLGELYLELGRYEDAERALQIAQQAQPTDVRPCVALARLCLLKDRHSDALGWAQRAVELEPERRLIRELKASIHQRMGEREAAIRELEAAEMLTDDPLQWNDPIAASVVGLRQDPVQQYEFGRMLLAQGHIPEAIEILQDAVATDSRDPRMACVLAQALIRADRLDAAAAQLERAMEEHPDSAEVWFQSGVISLLLKDNDLAERQLRKAIQLKPSYALAHYNLGHTMERLGGTDAALQSFLNATRFRPTHADAHTNAGRLLVQQGKPEEAIAHLATAVRFAPGSQQAQALLAHAKKMKRTADSAIPNGSSKR